MCFFVLDDKIIIKRYTLGIILYDEIKRAVRIEVNNVSESIFNHEKKMNKYGILFLIGLSAIFQHAAAWNHTEKSRLIMLHPAGDTVTLGRSLGNNYERTIAYKLAEKVAKGLQEQYQIRTVLTRNPGEVVTPYQYAAFANRARADIFIAINVYYEPQDKPRLYSYYRMVDPFVDVIEKNQKLSGLIHFAKTHQHALHTTQLYGEGVKHFLMQEKYAKLFEFSGAHGIPLKQLEGIVSPALLFEVGIHKETMWDLFTQPIIDALKCISEY